MLLLFQLSRLTSEQVNVEAALINSLSNIERDAVVPELAALRSQLIVFENLNQPESHHHPHPHL